MIRMYIDPGTGSMLFTILIGVLGAGIYALRTVFMKLRFMMSGGRKSKEDLSRIPFAIFTDSKRYWNIFEPICDVFEKREQQAVYLTASPDDPALKKEYKFVKTEFVGEGNRAFARLNLLKADVVLSSTPGLDVYQWKRSRDVKWYAHILHAANDATAYRMFGIDYYDAVLLSGAYQEKQVRELEKLRGLPAKETPLVGLPHLDEMKKRLLSASPLPEHPTTVLLAPSWGKSSIFSRFGGKVIDALLKTGCHVIVRPHPQSYVSEKEMLDKIMADYPESDNLEWNRDNDNFEVLRRSDILISDFSGVIFDFVLVFDKPIIYADTSFDKSPLDASWLDEDLWTFSALPRIGQKLTAENLDGIGQLIEECLRDPRFQQGREEARAETWVNIGAAAESTVDYLMNKRRELLEKEAKERVEIPVAKKSKKEKKAKKAKQETREGEEQQ